MILSYRYGDPRALYVLCGGRRLACLYRSGLDRYLSEWRADLWRAGSFREKWAAQLSFKVPLEEVPLLLASDLGPWVGDVLQVYCVGVPQPSLVLLRDVLAYRLEVGH